MEPLHAVYEVAWLQLRWTTSWLTTCVQVFFFALLLHSESLPSIPGALDLTHSNSILTLSTPPNKKIVSHHDRLQLPQ